MNLRDQLRWFDCRPLFGRRLLVPRAEKQARETAGLIRAKGAEPVIFPVISIEPPPDPSLLRNAVQALADYDWVVFTSSNGVNCFFDALSAAGRDARALGAARLAAIGPKTSAALKLRGLIADLVAEEYVGESLAQSILARGARRVLIPRALKAREALPEQLRSGGVEVNVVPAYQTCPVGAERKAEFASWLRAGSLDAVLFTSSSTVSAVMDLLGPEASELLSHTTVASIGPITSKTAQDCGLRVDVCASVYTVDGLLEALEGHFVS